MMDSWELTIIIIIWYLPGWVIMKNSYNFIIRWYSVCTMCGNSWVLSADQLEGKQLLKKPRLSKCHDCFLLRWSTENAYNNSIIRSQLWITVLIGKSGTFEFCMVLLHMAELKWCLLLVASIYMCDCLISCLLHNYILQQRWTINQSIVIKEECYS